MASLRSVRSKLNLDYIRKKAIQQDKLSSMKSSSCLALKLVRSPRTQVLGWCLSIACKRKLT